jgi:hypothetical protein
MIMSSPGPSSKYIRIDKGKYVDFKSLIEELNYQLHPSHDTITKPDSKYSCEKYFFMILISCST